MRDARGGFSRVEIYGAGLAGLVAAITLAREGREVHLFDRQQAVGGNPAWHPSVQTTVLPLKETERYIGIDLSGCFRPVDSITFHRYGRKKVFSLRDMHVCERGPGERSLDTYLFGLARGLGVQFHPSTPFPGPSAGERRPVIVATGLDGEVYRQLGIPCTPIHGFRGMIRTDRKPELITYLDRCTNYDFAYLAADGGSMFALLFSRNRLPGKNLEDFRRLLEETEGIRIENWTASEGAMPDRPRLAWGGCVLAGTLGGMIDPFVLHGISGALTSGKVAARAIADRQGAEREFRRLAKNFAWKKRLKAVSVLLPGKSVTLPAMMWIDGHMRGVGFVR